MTGPPDSRLVAAAIAFLVSGSTGMFPVFLALAATFMALSAKPAG